MTEETSPNDSQQANDADDSARFSKLGLSIGTSLSIEAVSPPRKYLVRLLGYSEGKSLLVSSPLRDGKEVLLDKNASLTVRLLEGKNVCAFETRVLYRSVQPYTYYHLLYPEKIESLQIRDSERIETSVTIRVDSDFDIVGDWPKHAEINNLSKTGARVAASTLLGQPGHELMVDFELPVSGMVRSISLTCIIRNVEQKTDSASINSYLFGIQFVDLGEDARLTLANYIYENSKPV